MKNWILFLDDLREPTDQQIEFAKSFPDAELIIIRSSKAAKIHTLKMGYAPIYIFFDHDLGEDDFGFDTVMYYLDWLIEMYYEADVGYSIHSSNPNGRLNIISKMESWKKSKTLKVK